MWYLAMHFIDNPNAQTSETLITVGHECTLYHVALSHVSQMEAGDSSYFVSIYLEIFIYKMLFSLLHWMWSLHWKVWRYGIQNEELDCAQSVMFKFLIDLVLLSRYRRFYHWVAFDTFYSYFAAFGKTDNIILADPVNADMDLLAALSIQ